jgi:integration host factor subunit beta
MIKSDLIAIFAEKHDWLRGPDARSAVEALLESLSNALAHGRRVEIRGFGAFYTTRLPTRIGRNPKTGARVDVPSKNVVRFKPSGNLVKPLIRQK